jgi:hypothetical protein
MLRTDCEFGSIRVATVDWPIVLTEFPETRVPDAALHACLDHLESLMTEATKTREKLFMLTDITRMREVTPASQRHYTGEWMKRNLSLGRVSTVGGATVTPSSILRGILTAVYWIQPPARPMYATATRHEAMLKGIEMLEAERIPLPPRLIAYRDGVPTRRAG